MPGLKRPIPTTSRIHRITVAYQDNDATLLTQYYKYCVKRDLISDPDSKQRSVMSAVISSICSQFIHEDKEFLKWLNTEGANVYPTDADHKRHFDSSKTI